METQAPTQPQVKPAIEVEIDQAQQKYMQEKIHRGRWRTIHASGIDDQCNRRLFYYLTCGELADAINPDLAAIFEEGNEQEIIAKRYLSELGFEIIKAQMTEHWDKFNIAVRCDGFLEKNAERYLVDIKSVSEYAWDSIYSEADLSAGYYRKWRGQMQISMLLFNIDKSLLILKRKQAKQLRAIPIYLDYTYAESLLKKADIVNLGVRTGTPPAHINNPVECKKCPFFGKVCNPSMDYGEAILNLDDPELAIMLEKRDELALARSEYERLDKDIKERFKEIPDAICGDFHITGKGSEVNIKAKDAYVQKKWTTKIERISCQQE